MSYGQKSLKVIGLSYTDPSQMGQPGEGFTFIFPVYKGIGESYQSTPGKQGIRPEKDIRIEKQGFIQVEKQQS